jgi:DNA polymerase elongation subunit (family B)
MVEFEAWLLDAYADKGTAVAWFTDISGRPIRAHFKYRPDFYVHVDEEHRCNVRNQIEALTGVMAVEEVLRREAFSQEEKTVLKVTMRDTIYFNKIVRKLKNLEFVKLYNIHILHSQRVLYKLGLEPGCKALLDLAYDGSLLSLTKVDDREVLPPPFKVLAFRLTKKGRYTIDRIDVFSGPTKIGEFAGEPNKILFEFASVVRSEDPDILICNARDDTFTMLLAMSRLYGMNLQLGRDRTDIASLPRPLPYWVRGRVVLDEQHFDPLLGCWGLAGILERSRFGFLPIDLAAEWTSNRLVDSRNTFELLQHGVLIPAKPKYFEPRRNVGEMGIKDKGAIIMPPLLGVHDNVAELDFESEFANIMVRDNISYETISERGDIDGLLPGVIKKFLDRRLYFKRLRSSLPQDSEELDYCEQRQTSLKLMLCVLYGTSGCAWNRFGNVLAFEKINAMAREVMLEATKVAEERGFRTLYADTDSLFVRREDATETEYKALVETLNESIGLPLTLDHHYRFLVLLPRKEDAHTPAFKRYYGLTYGGELVCRGIECRRHDTPLFIKEVQEAMMKALLFKDDLAEVYTKGLADSIRVLNMALKRLERGDIEGSRLCVTKIMRKEADQYFSLLSHVSAGLRMKAEGEDITSDSFISYIYKSSDHRNPLCRVVPFTMKTSTYDTSKYKDLLTGAASTILAPLLTRGMKMAQGSSRLDDYI